MSKGNANNIRAVYATLHFTQLLYIAAMIMLYDCIFLENRHRIFGGGVIAPDPLLLSANT